MDTVVNGVDVSHCVHPELKFLIWWLSPRLTKPSIFPGSLGCCQALFGIRETLTYSSAGHRNCLYRPSTHSNCLRDSPSRSNAWRIPEVIDECRALYLIPRIFHIVQIHLTLTWSGFHMYTESKVNAEFIAENVEGFLNENRQIVNKGFKTIVIKKAL